MLNLLTFPIYFEWQQTVNWDVLIPSKKSQVLLHRLHFTKSIKASWLRYDEHPGLDSSLNDILPEQNFENQFLDLASE